MEHLIRAAIQSITLSIVHDYLVDYARPVAYIIYMNRLSIDERAQILAALVEGNSIRSRLAVCCPWHGSGPAPLVAVPLNTILLTQGAPHLNMFGLAFPALFLKIGL